MSAIYNRPASPGSSLVSVFMQAVTVLLSTMALSVLSVAIVVGAFEVMYAERVYPGVLFRGVELSGLTRAEALDQMTQQFNYAQTQAITLRDGGRSWAATPGQLGVSFDAQTTLNRVFSYGRSGSWPDDLQAQWDAWYNGYQVAPMLVYDLTQAEQFVRQVAAEIDTLPVEAQLEIQGLEVLVTPGVYGRTVDVDATLAQLETPLSQVLSTDIPLVIDEYRPDVLDASQQAELARRILSEPLAIRIGAPVVGDPEPWVFDQNTLAQMLKIQRVEKSDGTAEYTVGVDNVQLRGFLESIAPDIEKTPKNARFIFNDDTRELELIGPATIGRTLNVEESIRVINEQLVAGSHSIPLTFDLAEPLVNDDTTAAELGITGLVSSQTSYFAGSSTSREHNIATGAATMHGVLVPPGGTFSFNEFLGDISLDTGFAEALIIYGGRTIQGVGGGICQVSTTAFRTAWYGGYPIVERNQHAYRVSYYEQGGFGPGTDATIFTPLVDFKFQNDRDSWLLIETYVSKENNWLTYKFYSGDDGRKVSVGQPVIRNTVEYPPALWEENSELAAGEVKQVDWAVDGMDVTVERVVTGSDGTELIDDAVQTHYLPWRAVCQYGPGTDLAAVENRPGQCTLPVPDTG